MAWRRTALIVTLAGALLAGCNDDGRTLAPASSTTTAAPATTTSEVLGAGDTAPLAIGIPGLVEGGLLDPAYTCDGEGSHPPLEIRGAPAGGAALAITVVDLDADGYVHWVLAGLPPDTTQLGTGEVPDGTVAARSDGGVDGWEGPCPPEDDAPHRYQFSVYASAEPIGLAEGLDGREAIDIIEAAAVATGRYTVRYGRASG